MRLFRINAGRSDDRKAARVNLKGIVALVSVLVVVTAPASGMAQPPKPFLIYGGVFNTTNQPLLNPDVTVKNLNTSEDYDVETNASYNYYQVITSSCNVSAGDMLKFNASDGVNSVNYTVTVTSQNMTDGGLLEQNLTISAPHAGICGDVDGNGKVDSMDYVTLRAYIVGAPGWTITSGWAADVDCNTKIDSMDYVTLRAYIVGAPGWTLNCC